jgi:selenide,water dikinase
MQAIPTLEGALECLEQGIASSLQPQNIRLQRAIEDPSRWLTSSRYQLLFDPQTSGGLLASVPQAQVESCLSALHETGYPDAMVIGQIQEKGDKLEMIELLD